MNWRAFPRWVTWCGMLAITIQAMRAITTRYQKTSRLSPSFLRVSPEFPEFPCPRVSRLSPSFQTDGSCNFPVEFFAHDARPPANEHREMQSLGREIHVEKKGLGDLRSERSVAGQTRRGEGAAVGGERTPR